MEDLMSSAKISTKEVGSCSSTELEKKLVATFLLDSHVTVSQDLLRNKYDETTRTHESSLQDDRSHWDLNTAMDAWERPFEYQCLQIDK